MSGRGFDDLFSALSLTERWRGRKVIGLVVGRKGGWQALPTLYPLGNQFYAVTFSRSVITLMASSGAREYGSRDFELLLEVLVMRRRRKVMSGSQGA
jgi:hypothetical protein